MSTAEVFPNLKMRAHCTCKNDKCTAYGTPKGKHGHPEGCIGKCCANARNRKKGTKAQVATARKMGSKRVSTLRPGNEETLDTFLRFEKKTTAKQHTVHTFYDRTRSQSEGSRSLADNRPFVGVAQSDNRTLWVIDESDWDEAAYLTAVARGWCS